MKKVLCLCIFFICNPIYAWWEFRGGPVIDHGLLNTNTAKMQQLVENTLKMEVNLFELMAQLNVLNDQLSLDMEIWDTLGSDPSASYNNTSMVQQALGTQKMSYFEENKANIDLNRGNDVIEGIAATGRGGSKEVLERTNLLRQINESGTRELGYENLTKEETRGIQTEDDYIEYAMLIMERENIQDNREVIRRMHLDRVDISNTPGDDADNVSILNSWNLHTDMKRGHTEAIMLGGEDRVNLEYNKLQMFQRRNEYISSIVEDEKRRNIIENVLK